MTDKDYIESYIKALNKREERLGKYLLAWEDTHTNSEE